MNNNACLNTVKIKDLGKSLIFWSHISKAVNVKIHLIYINSNPFMKYMQVRL